MEPLLSIVIANYNYGRFLEEAIQSVLSQSCQDFELIVCDAASKDNSVEVIKKYENRIAWWCSENDGGQSAAFNKGFSHARGRFLTWLNADDVMLPGTIANLKRAFERYPTCPWFIGGVLWLDQGMRIMNCGRARRFSEIRYRYGNVSTYGPSSFFTKELLVAVGGVDERFHYSMDTDLWLRFAWKKGARYKVIAPYAWGLRLHPEAKMSGHNFSNDGTLKTAVSESERLKASKHYQQMLQEDYWMREYFPAKKRTKMAWLVSVNWIQVLQGRFDKLRFKGRYYLEAVK